jgi:CPA2 family monovalent cation:H+ antiporter-2
LQLSAAFDLDLYKEPLLFLGVAGVVVPLFRRIRVSPVLGFLVAGMLIGPHVLGRLDSVAPVEVPFLAKDDKIAAIADFGVVFLLFTIGLELSLERLRVLRRFVFGLGALQMVSCSAVLFLVGRLFGLDTREALILGAALSLSSTAIVVPVLAEKKRLAILSGRAIFAVLLFQDLLVAPLLFMISMLGPQSQHADLLWTLGPALLAIVLIVGVGRLVLRPLFHLVSTTKSAELFMAACLLVVISTAVAAASAGLSMSLGAFIAGLLLAETEYRRQIEQVIEPFKGLLLGLFFVSVGAGLDPMQIFTHPLLTFGLALALVAIKAPIIMGLSRMFGPDTRQSREIGLLLGPGGEFAFVMIAAAIAGQSLSPALGSQVLIGVTISMAMIPLLAHFAAKFNRSRAVAVIAGPAPDEEDASARVIIVGYGRVGQVIGAMMRVHNIDFIVIEGDARVASEAHGRGEPVYWGDATAPGFLKRCGLAQARALVVTMHTPSAVDAVVKLARQTRADLTIVARARDANHARNLYKLGVTDAVPETMEASLQLSEAALVDIGVPMGLVIASIHEQRDIYRKTLQIADAAAPEARPFSARRQKRAGGGAPKSNI